MDVERALRLRVPPLADAAEALRESGLWAEATALQTPGLLSWAIEHVEKGALMTAADPAYPRRWMQRLGRAAPPTLWLNGVVPPGPFVAIVGSRVVPRTSLRFANACAGAIGSRFAVASGGAKGCDSAAIEASRKALCGGIEILPFGLSVALRTRQSDVGIESGVCRVSVCAPLRSSQLDLRWSETR